MKKLLIMLMVGFSCSLHAEIGKDQFTQLSFPIQQTYGTALELCKEKGFSHFLVKKISYSDKQGQTVEIKGVPDAEGSTLISNRITHEFDAPLGNIVVDFELLCFKEAPKNPLAVNVEEVFNFVASMQNNQPVTASPDSQVREIGNMEELQAEIAKSTGIIYLDCYSSHCPPCKMLSPKFDGYSKDLSSKGTFLKISLDQVPEIASEYKIKSIPTLIVFKEKKEVERKTSLPEILKYFENLK